jgi:autotransporter strand-loop-strand O-heptosyltransferase
MICSTFWNTFFEDKYPDIDFVSPGQAVPELMAMYTIGLFYNSDDTPNMDRHPIDPRSVPLQKIASDILGLEYEEVRPLIVQPTVDNTSSKQVCIAVHSTTQAKYWNNPFGWQEVVNWLKNRGYTVKLLSEEGMEYMGNRAPTGVIQHPRGPIQSVMEEMKKSQAFIGIGSGLSWLSWTLNVPTVLVSGFSYKWAEMKDCIRVGAPKGKCEGCFNRHRLNAGDWNWCPDHKGTPRQFECSREITADMVIKELEKIL